jgi:hypothetical protein
MTSFYPRIMAQRVQTVLVSDLSGDEVEAGRESVTFSYKGVDYVIDLTAKEADEFDRVMAVYVTRARKAPRSNRRPSGDATRSNAQRTQRMRRWAAEQGLDYPRRGRLPKSLVEAYDAAH